MTTTHATSNSTQHAFLFDPDRGTQKYGSADDFDSPPSLTNSSESPRSTSEEGGSSSPHSRSFDTSQQVGGAELAINRKAVAQAIPDRGNPHFHNSVDDDDDEASATSNAMTPNWDTVFGSTDTSDMMDLSSDKPNSTALTSTASLNKHMAVKGTASNTPQASTLPRWPNANEDTGMSDDAMFESLIQQEEFDTATTDKGEERKIVAPVAPIQPLSSRSDASALAKDTSGEITPPQSAHPSASAVSSRRNSNEPDNAHLLAAARAASSQPHIPHTGSHYSHTSDADLPSSSQIVVSPPLDAMQDLQVHVHGISFSGAKSRVETQIRLRVELVRPVPVGQTSKSTTGFERVGTFNHVKLPPLTGTKRRSKKHKQMDVEAEKTLFMDAAVVRATPPHERVFVCKSCQQREKKRAQRRKAGAPAGGKGEGSSSLDDDLNFSLEDYQELGVDPNAPDARAQAKRRAEEEDEKRVVVFNCGDFVTFEDGACVLPTRITCYCRHHREKTGFCLIFTMRDYRGKLIATGSTPPIMITDDHKSVAAAAAAAAAATPAPASAITTHQAPIRRVDGPSRSRAGSSEVAEDSITKSANANGSSDNSRKAARRAQRSKPYGDAESRSGRRNTSASFTPHGSTGQNTPAVVQSPPAAADANPDFWNAFAAMANLSTSPSSSSRASVGMQTPHTEATSPLGTAPPMPMPNVQTQTQHSDEMQEYIANLASQGSISSQTLNVGPQSLPGFDLASFLQSLQRGQREGDPASMEQLVMLARSLPGTFGGLPTASYQQQQTQTHPIPTISKLIPGDGPTSGGIEVTVLGENFVDGLTCFFGDVPATSTRVWGSNTLLCILPPSASPGPVAVTLKSALGPVDTSSNERQNGTLQLFTYVDATDRALMELALQVVGLQMTGQMQSARDVAMRVVGSGPNQGMSRAHGGGGGSGGSQQAGDDAGALMQSRNAVANFFASSASAQSFQDSVLTFLQTLDVCPTQASRSWYRRAIRLANKQGHTLLHLAVILGFQRLAVDLIARGCPVNARDHNGYTALHFAALHGKVSLARSLLSHGASGRILCDAGLDALDVARSHGQDDVEDLLEPFEVYDEEEDLDESTSFDSGSLASIEEDESEGLVESEDEEEEEDEEVESDHIDDVDVKTPTVLEGKSATKLDNNILDSVFSADEKSVVADAPERKVPGLKGLVSGGIDFATLSRFGMPNAIHGGLTQLHVPVVSVFQMAMPPFANWATRAHDRDALIDQDDPKQHDEPGRQLGITSTWRHVLEESALWINPLSSPPPPAYETLDAPLALGTSRYPAIASTKERDVVDTSFAQRSSVVEQEDEETTEAVRSSNVPSSSRNRLPSTSSSNLKASNNSLSKRQGKKNDRRTSSKVVKIHSLAEDRMLVYFWLPILVSVILLVFFAKPSTLLSYGDLMSFMPF